MDIIQNIFGSLTRLLVIVGAGVSTVSICFAAFQWMTAQGDPQGVNKARMGLMGAVGGLILVGTAFIIPRVIGETVIEQVGGVSVTVEASQDCDEILREQFVFQRNASTVQRLNDVIGRVQSQHRETCSVDIWDPKVVASFDQDGDGTPATADGSDDGACHDLVIVGGQSRPSGLAEVNPSETPSPGTPYPVRYASSRDRDNNIIVHWHETKRPTDNAKCWMYVSGLDRWFVQY